MNHNERAGFVHKHTDRKQERAVIKTYCRECDEEIEIDECRIRMCQSCIISAVADMDDGKKAEDEE